MWLAFLILLILAIAALLWWRARMEREWRMELAYLTRHQKDNAREEAASGQPETIKYVPPVVTNMRDRALHRRHHQALSERLREKIAAINPRHKSVQTLSEEEKQRLSSDEALAELPIFADKFCQQGETQVGDEQNSVQTAAEQEHDTNTAADGGSPSDTPKFTVQTAILPALPAPSAAGSVPQNSISGSLVGGKTDGVEEQTADAVTNAQANTETQAGSLHSGLPENETAASKPSGETDSGWQLSNPDQHLEVITLEEATRKVATRVKNRMEEKPKQPVEMVKLNWPLRPQTPPPPPKQEITADDPTLSRVLQRTEAERHALRETRSDGESHFRTQVKKSDGVQIINEDDIRSNLLRQRLARRRHETQGGVHASPLPVIAEDEVLANLSKTDSPVNKQKFRRATVRESVIPAAARIGQSHALDVSPVAAALGTVAGAVPAAPISSRFTPFDHSAAQVQAASADGSAETVAAATPVQAAGVPAAHMAQLHMTDAPQWSIRDRLQQARQAAAEADNTDGGAAAVWQDAADWEHVMQSDAVLPETTPVYAPPEMAEPFADGMPPADTLPVRTPSAAVAGYAAASAAPSFDADFSDSFSDASDIAAAADNLSDTADDDMPEWQKTLNEAMAQPAAAALSGNRLGNAKAAFARHDGAPSAPLQAAATMNAPAQPQTPHQAQSNRNQMPHNVSPNTVQQPPRPAEQVPQTAMGLALQHALQHAPKPAPQPQHHELTLPNLNLLLPPQYDPTAHQSEEALLENGITIEEKLAEFKVKVNVVDAYAGPVITRYEIEPAQGVRGSQVVNLEKDLARSLGFASIRVVETIPGKTCMGLELPNPKRQIIRLSEVLNAPVFQQSKSKLTLALGQDITGQPVVTDLAKAPHLLVAGTTGSGKSVGVNAMILSMLFKSMPDEVRLIMIDPKMLELSIYEGIPHLLAPVVTDMKLAANALTWCVNEMEKRYRLMSHLGVRNLAGFNQKVVEAAMRGQKIANPFSLTPDDPEPLVKLPYIVVVVDEFADLMMTAGKKIEELIARLAQKARAAGIHLILATQRPSVDVITGLIKANIPTRIAFQVSSKVDSRTILDQMGAENLLGQGDMLFLPPGTGYPQRVHGAFVADEEVHRVVEYLKQFGEPDYVDDILTAGVGEDDLFSNANGSRSNDGDQDPLYDEAVAVVVKTRKASISSVQRQLRIGYNRAARLVEQMEADGIVSPAEGNGNRTVLAPDSSHLDD